MTFQKLKNNDAQEDSFYIYTIYVIIIISFALRISSIRFGYPLMTHPDEPFLVDTALNIIKTGDINPHFFNYPSLVIYIQAILDEIICIFYKAIYNMDQNEIPKINFHMAGRALASFASVISIIFVYKIGKIINSIESGIIAAGIIAVTPLHVENSAFVTTDIWVSIFTTFVLFYSVKILESGNINNYILAGVFVGLSMGSKYTAAVSFVTIITTHYLFCRKTSSPLLNREIFFSIFSAGFTFIATTPFSVLDPRPFLGGIIRESRHYSAGHPGHEAIGNYSFKLYFDIITSNDCLGYITTGLALISALVLFRTKNRYIIIVAVFPIVFFLLLGSHKVYFARNIVAIIPPLALLCGLSIQYLIKNIKYINKNSVHSHITLFFILLILTINPFGKSYSDVIKRNLEDTRWVAIKWIQKNIPSGSKIAREYYTPPIEQYNKNYNVVILGRYGLIKNSNMIDDGVSYVILSSDDYDRFFDGTEKNREPAEIYSKFFITHKLIYEMSADNVLYNGPTIKIFSNK